MVAEHRYVFCFKYNSIKIAMKTDLIFAIFPKPSEMHKVHALTRSSMICSTSQVYLICYFVYIRAMVLSIINNTVKLLIYGLSQNYFAFTWNLVNFTWFLNKEKK